MEQILNPAQKIKIIDIVRKTLIQYTKKGKAYLPKIEDSELKEKKGVFITLRKRGVLRGCVGCIESSLPLYLEARDMAIAAASQDPRFPPLAESELENLQIEVSVLSSLKKVKNPDEIILGEHGVLVKKNSQTGVFLPQVARETGWQREEFMNNLCLNKAGIRPDSWKNGGCDIFIFRVEAFSDKITGKKG